MKPVIENCSLGFSHTWSVLGKYNNLLLEKNYCFMGFVFGDRTGEIILNDINNTECYALNKMSITID